MKYSKEFKALIDSTNEDYIGHGNPNAKILFIGQEPAIDKKNNAAQYAHEIADNAEQWHNIVANGTGYDSIDPSKIEFGSPLHPWANQKFQVRSGSDEAGNLKGEKGTARTWYNYQKLVNRILELYSKGRKPMNKNDHLDFHRLSFHTDMSDAAYKKHSESVDGKQSVTERVSLLSADFFRNFPIVIAAVGHFPRETYGDSYFGDIFGVEFNGNKGTVQDAWINVNIRNDKDNPMLLIHTPQFSGWRITNQYIDQIATVVVDFVREHKITLMPEE